MAQLGTKTAERVRELLCRGYQGASTKHVSDPVRSITALKAASAALRQDIQAWLKHPEGEIPAAWKHSVAHKQLLAQHKAEDEFDVLESIDAVLPSLPTASHATATAAPDGSCT